MIHLFFRRRVLKNIRVIVFCDEREHIVYSSQLYRCRLDDSVVPDFEHLLSDAAADEGEDPSKPPSFEHEWTTNEVKYTMRSFKLA